MASHVGCNNVCSYSSFNPREFGSQSAAAGAGLSCVNITGAAPPGGYVVSNAAARFDRVTGSASDFLSLISGSTGVPRYQSTSGCWSFFWKPETDPTEASGVEAQIAFLSSGAGLSWKGDGTANQNKLCISETLGTTYGMSANTYPSATYSGHADGNGWYWIAMLWARGGAAVGPRITIYVYHYNDVAGVKAWRLRESFSASDSGMDIGSYTTFSLGQLASTSTSKWMITNHFITSGYALHTAIPTITPSRVDSTALNDATVPWLNELGLNVTLYLSIDDPGLVAPDDDTTWVQMTNSLSLRELITGFPNSLGGGANYLAVGGAARMRSAGTTATGTTTRFGIVEGAVTATDYVTYTGSVATFFWPLRIFYHMTYDGDEWTQTDVDNSQMYLAASAFQTTRKVRVTEVVVYVVTGTAPDTFNQGAKAIGVIG